MNKRLRIAASTAAAAVALGIAAPAANAVEHHRHTAAPTLTAAELAAHKAASPATATNGEAHLTAEQIAELAAAAQQVDGAQHASAKVEALKALFKKSGDLLKPAIAAAKRGTDAFNRWVNSLSNWNPAKWVIKASPGMVLDELIGWLTGQ
ncbi:hypothetical protein [Streptomyces paromomycinus]|uniref:Secreted protein n=1 Tax=Streptomyces paromomycinus TaxID=92743 RepID=A0A401WBJ7_STREY|nr:hypothetical protein [Streptomyces paromomycinus]GCD46698.1 hypothetical protein GKJPGBOP_06449 [Streptomyces paromomycinus]